MSEMSEMFRKTAGENDARRDAGLTTPDDIRRYDDIVYGSDPHWQVLDVYRPREVQGKLPVIVSVHGGGWVYGDKELYQFYCMSLAQRGFAVVNFTYRLAPEYKYPASLEDTNSVFTWILKNEAEYGFDVNHIFAVGDSAGAHNLALYSSICTNPAYAGQYSLKVPDGFAPRAIALNCGVYRVRTDDSSDEMTKELMKDLLPQGGTAEELELIDATRYITPDFPPTFLMTSTGDFLKEQAPLMEQELRKNAVPFLYRFYGDKDKQLQHVFHCDIKSADADICNDDEGSFFRSFC